MAFNATQLARCCAIVKNMEPVSRKVVYRLYPSRSQEVALLDMLGLHQRLYNAALEQRIAAWRLQRKSLSGYDQCRDLTELRADDERYAALNAQSAQVTLHRLHLAFAAFFRRCEKAETPGFPRFKAFDRFSGWGYKTHGDGFRFTPGDGNKHGRLRLSGVGTISARGRARTPGDVKTCEIQHKAGRWYASLTMSCQPRREGGTSAVGLDWGVETFATLAHEHGDFSAIEVPSRRVKPSQTCSGCGRQRKKPLLEPRAYLRLRLGPLARSERRTRESLVGAGPHRPGTDRVPHAIRVSNTKLHPAREAPDGVVHWVVKLPSGPSGVQLLDSLLSQT